MSSSKGKKATAETQADSPTVVSVQDCTTPADGDSTAGKPGRTRSHRGQECPILKTTRDIRTGAIHDHILYTRSVINRRTGDQTAATVGKKLRRPGTGVAVVAREEVIEE